jgi:glutaminase
MCKSAEELQRFIDEAKTDAEFGKVTDYIPALGKANPND